MSQERTSLPINRAEFEDRHRLMQNAGYDPRAIRSALATASEIEEYFIAFTEADWVRVSDYSPGNAKIELWGRGAKFDFDMMVRLARESIAMGITAKVCPPTIWKRIQLAATYRLGDFLTKVRSWLFKKLGGTSA